MTLCLWMQPDPVSAPHVLSLVDPDQPSHYHLRPPNTADNLLITCSVRTLESGLSEWTRRRLDKGGSQGGEMVVGGPLGSLGGDGSGPARPVQAELAGKGGTAWGTDQGGMF